jgi:Zn-dependent metalloprotease
MKTFKILVVLSVLILTINSCKKSRDIKICTTYTELVDQNHLVDISLLSGAPELLDTLNKYHLQVYKIINDQYIYGMHCNVFYKGLKVFTDQYLLFKRKSDNTIYTNNSHIVDSINIVLTPTISFDKAIHNARQHMNFDNTCISYRLGLYDLNSVSSNLFKNYKLIWKVEGENGYPYVMLDANSGEIYSAFDGKTQ